MKIKILVVLTLMVMSSMVASAADEGAALYKKRCAGCHGATGQGKPAVKAPALKGTALDADKITDHVLKGEPNSKPPHNKGLSGITAEQAKSIAQYVKTLK